MTSIRIRPSSKIVVVAAVVVLAGMLLFSNLTLKKQALHVDATGWVMSGYFYTELLVHGVFKGNFLLSHWKQQDSFFNMQGNLGKWLLGIPVWIRFHTIEREKIVPFSKLTLASFREMRKAFFEDLRAGNESAEDIVVASRCVSAFFGVTTCLIAFAIGKTCGGTVLGLLIVVLMLSNRLFVKCATVALPDIFYVFFNLSSCLALAVALRNSVTGRALSSRLSILLGMLVALAGSVKFTGILVGWFFISLYGLFEKFSYRSKCALHLILFGCATLVVVYGINPQFWVLPSTFRSAIPEAKSFTRDIAGKLKGHDVSVKLSPYPHLTDVLKLPHVFFEWNYLMKQQQEELSKRVWGLNPQDHGMTIREQVLGYGFERVASINRLFFLFLSRFPPAHLLFLVVGILFSIVDLRKAVFEKRSSPYAAPLLFFLAHYIFIVVTLKLNWDRYISTTVIAAQVLAAIGIFELLKRIKRGLV